MAHSIKPETDPIPEMVEFFKALAEPTRLRIVGRIASESCCGQELAAELKLSPATVTHHLGTLRKAGLLLEERRAPYTYFSLNMKKLQEVLRTAVRKETVQHLGVAPDVSEEKRKVLQNFFDGETLRRIPAQRRKKEIIFEEILRRLPADKEYSEKELSTWLQGFHSDFCTIRREFIMGGYMERADGVYKLSGKGKAVRAGE